MSAIEQAPAQVLKQLDRGSVRGSLLPSGLTAGHRIAVTIEGSMRVPEPGTGDPVVDPLVPRARRPQGYTIERWTKRAGETLSRPDGTFSLAFDWNAVKPAVPPGGVIQPGIVVELEIYTPASNALCGRFPKWSLLNYKIIDFGQIRIAPDFFTALGRFNVYGNFTVFEPVFFQAYSGYQHILWYRPDNPNLELSRLYPPDAINTAIGWDPESSLPQELGPGFTHFDAIYPNKGCELFAHSQTGHINRVASISDEAGNYLPILAEPMPRPPELGQGPDYTHIAVLPFNPRHCCGAYASYPNVLLYSAANGECVLHSGDAMNGPLKWNWALWSKFLQPDLTGITFVPATFGNAQGFEDHCWVLAGLKGGDTFLYFLDESETWKNIATLSWPGESYTDIVTLRGNAWGIVDPTEDGPVRYVGHVLAYDNVSGKALAGRLSCKISSDNYGSSALYVEMKTLVALQWEPGFTLKRRGRHLFRYRGPGSGTPKLEVDWIA